jgi:hypothetical protein
MPSQQTNALFTFAMSRERMGRLEAVSPHLWALGNNVRTMHYARLEKLATVRQLEEMVNALKEQAANLSEEMEVVLQDMRANNGEAITSTLKSSYSPYQIIHIKHVPRRHPRRDESGSERQSNGIAGIRRLCFGILNAPISSRKRERTST